MGYGDDVLALSPSAYLRLGEGAGTTCVDAVGGASGTYTAPAHIAGLLHNDGNGAVDFNGTTAKAMFADRAAFDLGDVFTIAAVIEMDTVDRANTICDKGTNAYVLRVHVDNRLLLRRNGVQDIVKSTVALVAGRKYHVVATKSGATVKLYVDGVDVTGTVTNSTMADNSTQFGIGAVNAGTADFFDGTIDEVACFKSALSQAQVQALYAKAVPPARPLGAESYALPAPYRDRSAWPPAGWRPLRADEVWNTPIPAAAPLHERSAEIAANLVAMCQHQGVTTGGPGNIIAGAGFDDWQVPVYWASEADPLYTLHSTEPFGPWENEGVQIRCPVAAVPATGADAHMDIIQPDGTVWSLWEVAGKDNSAHTITLGWGGPAPLYGDAPVAGGAAVAIGNISSVGSIRACELEAGEINHAVAMIVGCTDGDTVYPANGGSTGRTCDSLAWDGDASLVDKPAIGMRLRLAYTVEEIDALAEPEWKKIIWRALATYGAIVTDTGGPQLRTESDIGFRALGFAGPLERYFVGRADVIDNGDHIAAPIWDGITWDWEVIAEGHRSAVMAGLVDDIVELGGQLIH